MTPDQAYAVLCQVELVPKQRGHGFEFRDVAVNERGQGVALVRTIRAPESLIRWFRDTKIASIEQLEYQPGGWWRVYFRLQELAQC